MNILEFNPGWSKDIAVCFVDNTRLYNSNARELIKNQADGVLANLYNKGYTIFQWIDEDALLKHVSTLDYKFALVFSTGTEFINGTAFFDALEILKQKDFLVAGHVLDRSDAYYELHHQCYVINLEKYRNLNCPLVGQQELGSKHIQTMPKRSKESIHDDYTPFWVTYGDYAREEYQHKCHGWNILSVAFENKENVVVFGSDLRDNKKHFYPENPRDFNKQLGWAYSRLNYCHDTFVHTNNTETIHLPVKQYDQIVTPASGVWFNEYLSPTATVIMYDYNKSSLEYWKLKYPSFKFVQCDLLSDSNLVDYIDTSIPNTLVNLSNIFNYEGTTFFYSLAYRKHKEAELEQAIKSAIPTAEIYFSLRASVTETIPTWHL
jgi:hypothetical protein